ASAARSGKVSRRWRSRSMAVSRVWSSSRVSSITEASAPTLVRLTSGAWQPRHGGYPGPGPPPPPPPPGSGCGGTTGGCVGGGSGAGADGSGTGARIVSGGAVGGGGGLGGPPVGGMDDPAGRVAPLPRAGERGGGQVLRRRNHKVAQDRVGDAGSDPGAGLVGVGVAVPDEREEIGSPADERRAD